MATKPGKIYKHKDGRIGIAHREDQRKLTQLQKANDRCIVIWTHCSDGKESEDNTKHLVSKKHLKIQGYIGYNK